MREPEHAIFPLDVDNVICYTGGAGEKRGIGNGSQRTRQGMGERKFVSVREAAWRLRLPEQSLYNARKRGTIQEAEGPDVPEGIWFEEQELNRWAVARLTNRGKGKRKKKSEKPGRHTLVLAPP